jgi:hypothetical protein
LLKVANSIYTRDKLVQIERTFHILGIAVIWCHSFTKLTGIGGKGTADSLSKLFTLLCNFLSTLSLIIYPSQLASDELANDFINNLFNSPGGGSIGSNPWYIVGGGLTDGDHWYNVDVYMCSL